jgi:hypothetical protein
MVLQRRHYDQSTNDQDSPSVKGRRALATNLPAMLVSRKRSFSLSHHDARVVASRTHDRRAIAGSGCVKPALPALHAGRIGDETCRDPINRSGWVLAQKDRRGLVFELFARHFNLASVKALANKIRLNIVNSIESEYQRQVGKAESPGARASPPAGGLSRKQFGLAHTGELQQKRD